MENKKTCTFVFYKFIDKEENYAKVRCTNCGDFAIAQYIHRWETERLNDLMRIKFCPHCGAEDTLYDRVWSGEFDD
jgi:predicted RNA-binding Zn-ribbon protein involved in translation (DUF1610 family)